MDKSKPRQGFRKLRESYVKRLPYIYIVIMFAISFLFLSVFIFQTYVHEILWLTISLYFGLPIFNAISVGKSAKELIYPEKLLKLERCRVFLFILSISLVIALPSALWVFSYLGFSIDQLPAPFDTIMAFLVVWLFFFIITVMPVNITSFLTPYRKARLCLQATIDTLKELLEQGKVPVKDAYRRFKWLKLAFQSSNDFLIKKPYYINVKNTDQYCQRIISLALVGGKDDLRKFSAPLQDMLNSFGNKKEGFVLPSFLVALKRILGNEVVPKESTLQLSEMLLVKPSLSERTKAALRSPITRSVISLAALLVASVMLILRVFY